MGRQELILQDSGSQPWKPPGWGLVKGFSVPNCLAPSLARLQAIFSFQSLSLLPHFTPIFSSSSHVSLTLSPTAS